MNVVLITAVWGTWHCDAFARATLPTLLASGNLPALAAAHTCRYVFYSTGESVARLEALPGFAQLRSLFPVEMNVMATRDSISSDMHLLAWQQAVDAARDARAAAVSLHPDVLWSDGSMAFLGRALSAGRKAVVVPNIRVIFETIVPELADYRRDKNGAVAVSGGDAAALALRHLHPSAAATIPGGDYSAASTGIFWPVPSQGLLLRHASRPAIAAVPHEAPLDLEFYMRQTGDPDAVLNVNDVDEMLMLSLAPLFKDFGLFDLSHPLTPLKIGLWCAHPQNDTPLNPWYAGQSLRLPWSRQSDETAWAAAARDSDGFMQETVVASRAIQLVNLLSQHGCVLAARLLAFALHETTLTGKLRCAPRNVPVILVPNDRALTDLREPPLAELLTAGNEEKLVNQMLLHYRPDWTKEIAEREMREAGIGIEASIASPRFDVIVIERAISGKSYTQDD
jgi:hypothetical protein